MRGMPVVATAHCEVALRDPRGGTMADGRELLEACLCGREHLLGLVEALLLEQSAPEDELSVADLVENVDAVSEELERVPRLLLSDLRIPGAEMNLRKRGDHVTRVGFAADVEKDSVGVLEVANRLLGLAELEVEAAEVV